MPSENDLRWAGWLAEVEEIEREKERRSIIFDEPKQSPCPTCANPFVSEPSEITLLVDDELYTVPVCEFCRDCPNAVLNSSLVSGGVIRPSQIFDCFVVNPV